MGFSAHARSKSKRALIRDVLAEAKIGVASPLELHYRRRVEIPHALPVGRRNLAEVGDRGRRQYRDVEYGSWGLVVELDGRQAHPPDQRFRDLRRDNGAVVSGRTVLRYGWHDVVGEPCTVAAQVALALHQRGWTGVVGRCSPGCGISPAVVHRS